MDQDDDDFYGTDSATEQEAQAAPKAAGETVKTEQDDVKQESEEDGSEDSDDPDVGTHLCEAREKYESNEDVAGRSVHPREARRRNIRATVSPPLTLAAAPTTAET